MESSSKITIEQKDFERIIDEVRELSLICLDDIAKKKLVSLLDELTKLVNQKDNLPLEEIIEKKLQETRHKDKDLNAKLYILYQNLIRGKISKQEAAELYEGYIRATEYDRYIY